MRTNLKLNDMLIHLIQRLHSRNINLLKPFYFERCVINLHCRYILNHCICEYHIVIKQE